MVSKLHLAQHLVIDNCLNEHLLVNWDNCVRYFAACSLACIIASSLFVFPHIMFDRIYMFVYTYTRQWEGGHQPQTLTNPNKVDRRFGLVSVCGWMVDHGIWHGSCHCQCNNATQLCSCLEIKLSDHHLLLHHHHYRSYQYTRTICPIIRLNMHDV